MIMDPKEDRRRMNSEQSSVDISSTDVNSDEGANEEEGSGSSISGRRDRRAPSINLSLYSNTTIRYSPNSSPEVNAVIHIANRTFDQLATIMTLVQCVANLSGLSTVPQSPINLNVFQGYPDEESMVSASLGEENFNSVLGTIAFYDIASNGALPAKNIKYALRFNELKTPVTNRVQSRYPTVGPGTFAGYFYYYSGFVHLQDIIDRAFIEFKSNATFSSETFIQQFPVPAYNVDSFATSIGSIMPIIMILAWIYSISILVKSIVYEKEQRLKEYMKMMGLSNSMHWLAWFITSFSMFSLSALLITFILKVGNVFKHSDAFIVFLLLELFAFASVMMSFAVSTFFSKARLAAACAGIFYFVSYLPYVWINLPGTWQLMTAPGLFAACLSSTTSFSITLRYIATYENAGEGVQWGNFFKGNGPCDVFSFGQAFCMMILDAFMYALVAWYTENVAPGEFGIPKPWFFPFLRSYWSDKQIYTSIEEPDKEDVNEHSTKKIGFEEELAGPKGIRICNLSKIYLEETCAGNCLTSDNRLAVSNLSLALTEGYITALLGVIYKLIFIYNVTTAYSQI